jgi:hypothetical protein
LSQALPYPYPWAIELVERGLQMLTMLLVVALAILLLVFAACILYLARKTCKCCSKSYTTSLWSNQPPRPTSTNLNNYERASFYAYNWDNYSN